MTYDADVTVVGSGIVGLATAVALAAHCPDRRVAVLDKESAVGLHQSGRNSGVVHSGIYYRPDSLKAAFCRAGRARMLAFCAERGIAHAVCGKLIVATDERELPRLAALEARGRANGLAVRRLDPAGVRELEPHVRCLAGLHVPEAGIADYGAVVRALADMAAAQGIELHLGVGVTGVADTARGLVLQTSGEPRTTRVLVNCAGLYSDRLARLAGVDPGVRIVPFRGEYYDVVPQRSHLVRGLVYPVPDPELPFLGVHVTRTVGGRLHAGPNAVLALSREGYRRRDIRLRDAADALGYGGFWRLARRHGRAGAHEVLRSASKQLFVDSLRRLVPELERRDLVSSRAGVRAQALTRDGSLVDDFLIVDGERSIHVCNAPSPGATSSLAIGDAVARRVVERFSFPSSRPRAEVHA